MAVHEELAKTTGRSAVAVVLIMIFIVLCIFSFNSIAGIKRQLSEDIFEFSKFAPGVISRTQAFDDKVPFATCVLASNIFFWDSDSFPHWENFSRASYFDRNGDIEIRFSFMDQRARGECQASLFSHPGWNDINEIDPSNHLREIIRALNTVNSESLFDESISSQQLGERYATALKEIGMEIGDIRSSHFEWKAETIISMLRRGEESHTAIANWIVYETSPFSGVSGSGVGDFELANDDDIAQKIDEFLFRQSILSLFYETLPDLPRQADIWSVANTHARAVLEPSVADSNLRLPFLGVGISYRDFLMVSGVVLVFFLSMFGSVQIEFGNHQRTLLQRERLVVFPRLTSRKNPLELNFSSGSDSMARMVWAAFLVAPICILSFATLFRYDASSVARISNSASYYFSRYQGLGATIFDLVNFLSLLITFFIVRALVRGRSHLEDGIGSRFRGVIFFGNFTFLVIILSKPLIDTHSKYFENYAGDPNHWQDLFYGPRIYVFSAYALIWLLFCLKRFSGSASEFFLVSGVVINGAIAVSLM
ncbi:hypothetical protein MUY35_00890 [Aliiroseovarius sp. S1339]|uniref:hypothetical protein n=1 Tax=Aliiroseovarius sp. S1339 TaxID=2936990 RepID=UPI0020BF21A1|nr:hypothetical protein [Aliiroseovarius sp. S1339]MCK8462401.1 hypothetical protein [Aliiroseovarius sp. S1339]